MPFARGEPTPSRVARHIGAISWLSLATVAGAAGVFALAGATVARHVLGSEYGGGTGAELGRLVVYFAPWMVASIAVTVAYPLLFVRGRARWLPLLAVGALGVHVLVEWAGRGIAGLGGVAAGLAVTTAGILAVVLAALGALAPTLRALASRGRRLWRASQRSRSVFPRRSPGRSPPRSPASSSTSLVLGVGRPPGLRQAWAYLHSLQ